MMMYLTGCSVIGSTIKSHDSQLCLSRQSLCFWLSRSALMQLYRVCQKVGPQTHDHNSVKSEPIKKISLENSLVNL